MHGAIYIWSKLGASWSKGSELGARGVSTVYVWHRIRMELYMDGAIYGWSCIRMEPYMHGAVYLWCQLTPLAASLLP